MIFATAGSAPWPCICMPASVHARWQPLGMGPCGGYGSSEAQVFVTLIQDGWGHAPAGTLTNPKAAFAIRDPATARDVPDGGSGELLLRGPSLFQRYLGQTEAERRWTADGYFRTGDWARRRGEGFVSLGRFDDAPRLGGYLVEPAEIESVLCAQPSIGAARVMGVEVHHGHAGSGLRVAEAWQFPG